MLCGYLDYTVLQPKGLGTESPAILYTVENTTVNFTWFNFKLK